MLRVVCAVCDSAALQLRARRRRAAALGGVTSRLLSSSRGTPTATTQTVLSTDPGAISRGDGLAVTAAAAAEKTAGAEPDTRSAPAPWTLITAAAVSISVGAIYMYRKMGDRPREPEPGAAAAGGHSGEASAPVFAVPARGEDLPAHVHYLVAGAGTAAFAAMRALRAARPTSRVLLVTEELALPYMRPPLSKELWREPDLARRARDPDTLTFHQWNGRRRSVVYEPAAFYTPVERLAAEPAGGTAVARGWRVTKIDVARHEAELVAPGQPPRTVSYDKCLVATGVRARRVEALREAAECGRSLALRGLHDAAQLADALDRPHVRTVAVLGGGFLATELSAALADRLAESGKRVVQVVAEAAPMAGVLPPYLADDVARRLREYGVSLVTGAELAGAELTEQGVRLRLAGGEGDASLEAEVVVECWGSEPDVALAEASGLETHPELGGLVVNAELLARADVYAAGDAACFYDVALGRRRVEHHDHAVVSGRLAGENMAALAPPKHYVHQSMFWSDLGPQLGYEAIGIIDSRLPTVGVFCADAVHDAQAQHALAAEAAATGAATDAATGAATDAATGAATDAVTGAATGAASSAASGAVPDSAFSDKPALGRETRYDRGVVFYLRDRRVVGVLLWNLFNRMHLARQVMAQGEFADLLEVAKLFAPHHDD